jgi:hypothetical protein
MHACNERFALHFQLTFSISHRCNNTTEDMSGAQQSELQPWGTTADQPALPERISEIRRWRKARSDWLHASSSARR